MGDNMKAFLYGWLNSNMKVLPEYNFITQGGRGRARLRFQCELRVVGVDYVALGNSTNKKDAQTNAARDFVNYLVRQGRIKSSEVPEFTANQLEGVASEMTSERQFVPNERDTLPDERGDVSFDPENPSSSGQQFSYIQSIFDQKKLEEAEAVDFTADLHGGWTIENAKSRLFQYLQMTKQSNRSDFKYSESGPPHNRNFSSEMTIQAVKARKPVYARETASSKQAASKACSLSLVRQLFHMGEIEAFTGAKKKARQEEVPPYDVTLTASQISDLKSLLNSLGIQPVQMPPSLDSNPDNPVTDAAEEVNLIVNYTLTDFEPQNASRPMTVPWAPPIPNWNPWIGANIDEGPEAFMSLADISQKLRQDHEYRMNNDSSLIKMLEQRSQLPIADQEQDILHVINNNQVTLVCGETGCGKTTQVPQYILDQYMLNGCGAECNILVTQPRRISAISIAERVAQERSENLGSSCGYAVRFETIYPRCYGGILYCTVGTLLRKMQAGMRGISHIIVDEIHERDINTDFLMIVLRDMIRSNKDLRVILMSATVDLQIFLDFFGDVALVDVKGRTFPVTTFFMEDAIELLNYIPPPQIPKKKKANKSSREAPEEENIRQDVDVVVDVTYNAGRLTEANDPKEDGPSVDDNCNLICDARYGEAVRHAMSQINEREIDLDLIVAILRYIKTRPEKGAVLIFLPGWNTITILSKYIKSMPDFTCSDSLILPLHSQIPREDQRKVFYEPPPGVTKIILATNIAETSITINDVMYVIDSCKAKLKLFTARNNLTNYATVWASRTNLEQRKGRAGRVREGFAFHLCSRARYERLEEHQTPEMLRTPLHEIALLIKLLRLGSIKDFLMKAIQPPPIDAVIDAEFTLREMKALDKNDELTPLGSILARMPIEPRLGKMVILSCVFGVADAMTAVASFCSVGDPFVMPLDRRRLTGSQRAFGGDRHSDHVAALMAYQRFLVLALKGGRGGGYQSSSGDQYEGEFGRKQSNRRINPNNVQTVMNFCDERLLSYPVMCTILEATEQLRQILINSGFPEEHIQWDGGYRYQTRGACPNLDVLISLMVVGLYPNVCYHKEKRKVLTEESKVALVHKSSVNCTNLAVKFPSPFFVFEEKLRTNMVACKQLTMVSPIQLLLFGARKAVWTKDLVVLDDWINLKMNFEEAAMIVALRPAIEALLIKICIDPEHVSHTDPLDQQMMDVIMKLCSLSTDSSGSGNDFATSGRGTHHPYVGRGYSSGVDHFSHGSFGNSNRFTSPTPLFGRGRGSNMGSDNDSPPASKRWCADNDVSSSNSSSAGMQFGQRDSNNWNRPRGFSSQDRGFRPRGFQSTPGRWNPRGAFSSTPDAQSGPSYRPQRGYGSFRGPGY